MNEVLDISQFRENNRYEAKLAQGGLPGSIWETYSAFANTDGGLILLGVKENKNHTFEIAGVENPESLLSAFWDTVNNQNKVSLNILTGTFHRNGEGDYRCTKEDVSEMLRDASATTADTKILKEMDESVFCPDSVKGYRNVFNNIHLNHVWESLDNTDFLRKIGAMALSAETGKLHDCPEKLPRKLFLQ